MACGEERFVQRLDWRRAATSPPRLMLACFGLLCFAVGIAVPNDSLGVPLVILGVGIVVFAIILPVVAEAEVGPAGFKFKAVSPAKDEEFRSFADSQKDRLRRFAMLLCGDADQSTDLVNEVLARAYVDRDTTPAEDRSDYLLCVLVRLVIGESVIGLIKGGEGPARGPVSDDLPGFAEAHALFALSPASRALLLLRHYADLDLKEIAAILGEPVDATRSALDRAESDLSSVLEVDNETER